MSEIECWKIPYLGVKCPFYSKGDCYFTPSELLGFFYREGLHISQDLNGQPVLARKDIPRLQGYCKHDGFIEQDPVTTCTKPLCTFYNRVWRDTDI